MSTTGFLFMAAFPKLCFVFLIITSQTVWWVPWSFFAHHFNRAIPYGLDGPRIEFRLGRNFSHQSRPALWPTQLHMRWIPGYSRG